MMTAPASPVRYTPAVEQPEPDEAKATTEIVETLHGIIETTYNCCLPERACARAAAVA